MREVDEPDRLRLLLAALVAVAAPGSVLADTPELKRERSFGR